MRKSIFVRKRYGRDLYVPKVGVCPHCRREDAHFSSRVGGSLLSRLFYGTWWCHRCQKPFRKTFIAKLRKR